MYNDEKVCTLCGEPVGDFIDNIYDGYCEECYMEAQESRLN